MTVKKGSVFITNGARITNRFCKYFVINNVSQHYVYGNVIVFDQLQEIFFVETFFSTKMNMGIDEHQLRAVHSNEMFYFIRFLLLGERVEMDF